MAQSVNISSFNLKKFNAFNKNNAKLKDKELFDEVGKMLVNYKWAIAHLEKIDQKYADVAKAQFDELVKQYDVKITEDKKATAK